MEIICLSKDKKLIKKINGLCSDGSGVKAYTDYRQIEKTVLDSCDVVVVDLKDCLLPAPQNTAPPILALSQVPVFQEAVAILHCGAKGYGNRHMRSENLAQAIDQVKAGQVWIPPFVVTELIKQAAAVETSQPTRDNILNQLSKREQEVALYVAEGMSNQAIAEKMFVSIRTVKAHLSSIYEKTNLKNRLELGLKVKK